MGTKDLMETPKKEPLLSPLLRMFMFAMVLANVASAMYPMLMPIYLTELGASITQVGLIFTLMSVVILVLQIFGGWVSDSIGRLRSIAIGSIGGIFGFIAVLLAPTWGWMLAALCVLQFPYALVGPSFGAFIAENSSRENRGKVYGLTDTIFQITGVIGPPLGGFLTGRYGFKMMFLASGILYALAAVLRIWMARSVRTTTESAPQKLSKESLKTSLKTMVGMIMGGGVLTWIFVTDGVRDTAFRLSGELQPLYLDQVAGITVEQIGLLGSIFSIAMMFTPILSGKLVDKYGERVPISLGFLLVFAAFMIFLQVSAFLGFAACWVVFGIGVGLLSPAYQSLISKVVPQKMLGTFTGLFRSSLGLISLPAPYLGAMLWERFSPQTPFIITSVAALITIIPTWLFFRVPEDQTATTNAETAQISDK
jgi:DHA1 family multidrug resistance protein-like MFS transporter